MHWRLILETPELAGATGAGSHDALPATLPGVLNMALDRLLLDSVRDGAAPTLRLYRWRPACLSFGRNQPACGLYDRRRAADRGIDIVRRPTGGLAVYHDRELTYAVAVPAHLFGGPRATYGAINRAIVRGLRLLGVEALAAPAPVRQARRSAMVAAGAAATDRPAASELAGRNPCFLSAAPGEVVAGGRKLVGSAQRRDGDALLQHGSILLDGDQSAVTGLQIDPGTSHVATGAITLAELLGRAPPALLVARAVVRGFESELGIRLAPAVLSAAERDRVHAHGARFGADSWTWRR